MIKAGQRLVPKRGNSLSNFTAFKSYEVVAGTGQRNLSPIASRTFTEIHSETSCNVVDDKGNIRFVSLSYFSFFDKEMGLF